MKKDFTKKQNTNSDDYELNDEYDFSKMTILPRGRFSPENRGRNIIVLAPDLARLFPNDDAVNEALRSLLKITQVSTTSV